MERSIFTSPSPDYAPADVYRGLRGQSDWLGSHRICFTASRYHGGLMETGYPRAVATLVVVADGSTSLYLSNGGGTIGAGQHARVRSASAEFMRSNFDPKAAVRTDQCGVRGQRR